MYGYFDFSDVFVEKLVPEVSFFEKMDRVGSKNSFLQLSPPVDPNFDGAFGSNFDGFAFSV